MFVNVQHAFTPLIVGSASFDYEPATLDGIPQAQQADIEEDSTHAGVAVSYLPTKNWTVTASYDYDFVDSAISNRGLNRSRYGVSATVVY
jgi:long-subunit fatty acid transport protein